MSATPVTHTARTPGTPHTRKEHPFFDITTANVDDQQQQPDALQSGALKVAADKLSSFGNTNEHQPTNSAVFPTVAVAGPVQHRSTLAAQLPQPAAAEVSKILQVELAVLPKC
jgi:hypothetical protein